MSGARITTDAAAAITAAVALEISAGVMDEDARYAARRQPTFRHDNPGLVRDPGDAPSQRLGGNSRSYAPGLARFANAAVVEPVPRASAALDHRHPAVVAGHSIFRGSVFDAAERPRVLIDGINNAKIGGRVTKGPWRGMPIRLLSLEERATCPRSCAVWWECYGNGMPQAVRFRHGAALIDRLDTELRALATRFPRGFLVRLHVLGDFPDPAYVRHWARWMRTIPPLRVWGYTAHPVNSEIGNLVRFLNWLWPTRWAVRFSVAPEQPRAANQVATIWEKPESLTLTPEGDLVCPQETGRTATCGTCGLCWAPALSETRIVFSAMAVTAGARSRTGRPDRPSGRRHDGLRGFDACPLGRMIMCHMIADTETELHAMADRIGIARRWFQQKYSGDHYDIALSKRRLAGAVEITLRQCALMCVRRREVGSLGDPETVESWYREWRSAASTAPDNAL